MSKVITGGIAGTCRDGVAVVFAKPFPSGLVPRIIFGSGGLVFSTTLGTGANQYRQMQANNITNLGFTPFLKLNGGGTFTARSATFSPSPGAPSTATKAEAAEAFGPTYKAKFSIEVQYVPGISGDPDSPGQVTVQLWARPSGGTFELSEQRVYESYFNSARTYTGQELICTDTGLAANAEFQLRLVNNLGSGHILTATTVNWDEGSGVSQVSVTPAGVPDVAYMAVLALD